MIITKYMDAIGIDRKCFVALVVAPKGLYPTKSYGAEFDQFADNVLNKKSGYINLFEEGRPEIMQDVAFKLFTVPLIGDSYDLPNMQTIKRPRATAQDIENYFIVKTFYNTVPYEELSEEQAIKKGKEAAAKFLEKYLPEELEIVVTTLGRHEVGTQILKDMSFARDHEQYLFDFFYCMN